MKTIKTNLQVQLVKILLVSLLVISLTPPLIILIFSTNLNTLTITFLGLLLFSYGYLICVGFSQLKKYKEIKSEYLMQKLNQ